VIRGIEGGEEVGYGVNAMSELQIAVKGFEVVGVDVEWSGGFGEDGGGTSDGLICRGSNGVVRERERVEVFVK
jgi:hypothetical protein